MFGRKKNNSSNLAAKIFQRQIQTPKPSTSINSARLFYENVVPNSTIYDVECPDHSFKKFTDDGQYLISFTWNQELVVFRTQWPSYSYKGGGDNEQEELSDGEQSKHNKYKFDSFFTQLYTVPLASATEFICKDFFIYIQNHHFGLFATSTTQLHDAPPPSPDQGPALQGVPYIEKITFHLLRLEDGVILDERVFHNDYVNLAHSMGVYLYDDLLAIVSLRFQRIHILQIRDSGNLVDVRAIGEFCQEDDQLFLNSNAQVLGKHAGSVPDDSQSISQRSFLSGIKQRLLSFIVRGIWTEETDPTLRIQNLKKKFYFHFQDYADLIIWKVQFLDRHHLLIKFGSVDGGKRGSSSCLFAVYNMETTEIIAFYQNSAEDLYFLFEHFCDHFHATLNTSIYMNFISSHANNIHACEQLRCNKNKASSFSQFVKKMLASLPINCQSQSPSPYFDQSLFRYDEKLISATDRHRQSTDHLIKFISRRLPYSLKFKIKPGPEASSTENRTKKVSSFLFHPILPIALSIQKTLFMQPSVVNIHFRN